MTINVAMNSAMTIDSIDTCVPERHRPHKRAAHQQVEDADEDRAGRTA